MDLSIIDQYGLPIAITIAFGYFIWKQQTWIQKELVDDLENQFRITQYIGVSIALTIISSDAYNKTVKKVLKLQF